MEIAKALLVKMNIQYGEKQSIENYTSYRRKGYSPIASAILAKCVIEHGEMPTRNGLANLEGKVE